MTTEKQNSNSVSPRRNRSFRIWKNLDGWNIWATRERRIKMMVIFAAATAVLSITAGLVSSRYNGTSQRAILGVLILAIFFVALIFATLLFLEIVRLLRRRRQTGPTQRRLVTLFVLMALVPTILVAVFSTITMNVGLENWFSNSVKNVVDSSYSASIAYSQEYDEGIRKDGDTVHDNFMEIFNVYNSSSIAQRNRILEDLPVNQTNANEILEANSQLYGDLRKLLNISLIPVSETVKHAFIISGTGEIISRGSGSYLFNYLQPDQADLFRASRGQTVIIKDLPNNEFIYLRAINANRDYYLYVSREVDGRILALLNETEETSKFYQDSEQSRQKLMVWFGLFYLTVAVIILMLAIWAALYFAARLTRPISQLVRTVERISDGDLDARVLEMEDDDEFSLLAQSFNQMTSEVQSNQMALKRASELSEAESRRFNNVLEGVSSGVIGTDSKGKITFINSAALKLLDIEEVNKSTHIDVVAPEFSHIVAELLETNTKDVQEQVSLLRGGNQETLFVRVSRSDRKRAGSMIISFDVVSDLVHAQRMAAWGDVARRIAHEIKNPLTPIRLSAERLKRRFGKEVAVDREKFEELTDIIVRQTEDLRRIVDEFSKFSRMPEAQRRVGDWVKQIQSAIALQEQNEEQVEILYAGPDHVHGFFDNAMIGQAFTNILKNGIEAIGSRQQREGQFDGRILINGEIENGQLVLTICDNGMGFPAEKSRLFEPYMTLKETGTGLGLPIVKKIIEDHEGKITLQDRPDGEVGACVQLRLPEHQAPIYNQE